MLLVVVIFVKLATGSAPGDQGFTADIFSLPGGTSLDVIATPAVFGFLSFAGFDGAAALGEETADPKRNIPRAIGTAVLVAGGFYIVVIIAQTLGFGTDAAGVKAFGSSSAPLGDLSKDYVGSALSDLINFGAMISAFASSLGTATAGSRILFALGATASDRAGWARRRRGPARRRER